MNDVFIILIFNLILFFVVFYISQNYKELFLKVDSLTFRINYINIVFLSFIPIFDSFLLRYYKDKYIFLFFYFIIYIVLSIKFSFLKRTTILCVTLPYFIFFEILEWTVGEEGVILIIFMNFIQTILQYRKEKLYKKIILSTLVIPLIIFSIPVVDVLKEKVEEKQLLHKIENANTTQVRIDYIFKINNMKKIEKTLEQFELDYESQLGKLDRKIIINFNLLMAFKIRELSYNDIIKSLDYVVKAKDKYKALEDLLEEQEIKSFNNFLIRAKNLKKEREELEKKFITKEQDISYSNYLYELNKLVNE